MTKQYCHKCHKPIVENYYCDDCDPNTRAELIVINPNIDN